MNDHFSCLVGGGGREEGWWSDYLRSLPVSNRLQWGQQGATGATGGNRGNKGATGIKTHILPECSNSNNTLFRAFTIRGYSAKETNLRHLSIPPQTKQQWTSWRRRLLQRFLILEIQPPLSKILDREEVAGWPTVGVCGATMGLTLYQSITPTSQQGVEEEQEVREMFVCWKQQRWLGCVSKNFISCVINLK